MVRFEILVDLVIVDRSGEPLRPPRESQGRLRTSPPDLKVGGGDLVFFLWEGIMFHNSMKLQTKSAMS